MSAHHHHVVDRAAPGRAIRSAVLCFIAESQSCGLPAELPADVIEHLRQAATLAAAVAGVKCDEAAVAFAIEEFMQRLQLWLDADDNEGDALLDHARMLLARAFVMTKH